MDVFQNRQCKISTPYCRRANNKLEWLQVPLWNSSSLLLRVNQCSETLIPSASQSIWARISLESCSLNWYFNSPIKTMQLGPANMVISTRPDVDKIPDIVNSGLFKRPPSNTPSNAPKIYSWVICWQKHVTLETKYDNPASLDTVRTDPYWL